MHKGHQALIHRARAIADTIADANGGTITAQTKSRGRVVALAFDPHPMTRLRPDAAPERLSTFAQREEWLLAAGADVVEAIEPTDALLSLSPEAFIARVQERFGAACYVEGPDFHFGSQRSGNVRVLAALGLGYNFAVEVVDPIDVVIENQLICRASSTLVRWLISRGRVTDAQYVLGRPYEVAGMVVRGDRLGRTIGFPTLNIETSCMLPGDGVYAGVAQMPDGARVLAAVNVGARPTVKGVSRRIEAHLIADLANSSPISRDGDAVAGLPEYGWDVRVGLTRFIRDQVRFESITHLCEQIARDIERIRVNGMVVRFDTKIASTR